MDNRSIAQAGLSEFTVADLKVEHLYISLRNTRLCIPLYQSYLDWKRQFSFEIHSSTGSISDLLLNLHNAIEQYLSNFFCTKGDQLNLMEKGLQRIDQPCLSNGICQYFV